MQLDKFDSFRWNQEGFWLGSLRVEDLDSLLELIQIPKAYIKRCIDQGFMDLVCANINYWMGLGPDLAGEVVDDAIIKIQSADYSELDLQALSEWFPLERLDMFSDSFVWSDSTRPYALGYSVTYLKPSLRVDSAVVCPKTGAYWLWTLKRVVHTRNVSALEVAMTMTEVAQQALEQANAKLAYFDCRYNVDSQPQNFVRAMCDSLRLNQKQHDWLLAMAQGNYEHNMIHQMLLQIQKSDIKPKMRRDLTLALSKRTTDGVFK